MLSSGKARQRLRGAVVAAVIVASLPGTSLVYAEEGPADPVAASAPQANQAQELYKDALDLYKQGDFDASAKLLGESHALHPRNETVFAWAQAERMAGRCTHANVLFERFIASSPPERQVEAARLAMRRCEEPKAPPRPMLRGMPVGPERAWYEDVPADVMAATGAVATMIGLGLVVSAHGRAGAAEGAPSLGEAQALRSEAETRWAWGLGVALAGVALASGAVVRYVLLSRTQSQASVAIGGRF